MYDYLIVHQVDIMLALSSICAMIAFFTLISHSMSKRRKTILVLMQVGAAIWLEADRMAYLYKSSIGRMGYFAVRISNFCVFMMTAFVLLTISMYLDDILRSEGGMTNTPVAIKISYVLGGVALFLVICSQFTGLYYTFDAYNTYHRSKLFFVSYIFPYLIMMIQIFVLARYRKRLTGRLAFSVFLFDVVCIMASLIQFFAYGVSLVDISAVTMVVGLYVFALIDMNDRVERANKIEIDGLREKHESMRRLFEKTASAMVTAIDAKDEFTKGHSLRVAEYSKEIARLAGMDAKSCDEAYFAGLMHDVGKVGISDDIIQKDSELSPDESDKYKKHAGIGADILANINEFPSLYVGAKYHHERYDGKGYPDGLSGENIPELARIVSVADVYDKLTSKKNHRDPLPQSTVREEILKRAGTQLDPGFCDIMVDMIDHDTEYMMRETDNFLESRKSDDLITSGEMYFTEYKEHISEGIQITDSIMRLELDYQPEVGFDETVSIPTIILFDSHDGCVHSDDREIRLLEYLEYCEIWFDGHTIDTVARDIRVQELQTIESNANDKKGVVHYVIEAVKYRDHVRLKMGSSGQQLDITVALPDAIRYCYLAFTGEHCHVMNVTLTDTGEKVDERYIPRIVQEVTYTERIEGDVPNVQIEGYRKAYSGTFHVADGMRVKFRTTSLPTANLIWHCAYILLFSSDDGFPLGIDYTEHCCLRLDGEDATNNDLADNEISVHKDEDFKGWDEWKKVNKKGFECTVFFKRRRGKITILTRNAGITIKCVTSIPKGNENVYMCLTGDQCAVTDIRVMY